MLIAALLLATAQPAYPCTPPPTNPKTGFVAREGTPWDGDKLGINNGMTWNHNTPYALCLGTTNDYARVELHDTSYDNGVGDHTAGEAFKRRAEFETTSKYVNNQDSYLRYQFRTTVTNLKSGFSARLMQVHWPSGASPAIGHSIKYANGGIAFVTSTKSDSTGNVQRGAATPVAQGTVHSVVVHFKLGGTGSFEDTYLDGKLVSHFVGPVGSVKENGYRLRLGNYGTIAGMSVVTEYRNFSKPTEAATDMSSYILNPPAF